MFGIKNTKDKNSSADLSPSYPMPDALKEKTAVNVADFPVHTMREDLKNAGTIKTTPLVENMTMEKTTGVAPVFNKIIIYAIIFLIIMLVLVAGYYFWSTRVKNTATITTPAMDQPIANDDYSSTTKTPDAIKPAAFSSTQANYLSLAFEGSNIASLEGNLKSYADKVAQMNAGVPIEFIITDANNNPLSFSSFAQKIKLSLTSNILSQLTGPFSLYIYMDNFYPRFGIAANIENKAAMELALTQEEKTLVHELAPLFLSPSYSSTDAISAFASSTYKGHQIRYANVTSPEPLSVDYTINGNQLVIGTSKLTTRAILDRLDSNFNRKQIAQ